MSAITDALAHISIVAEGNQRVMALRTTNAEMDVPSHLRERGRRKLAPKVTVICSAPLPVGTHVTVKLPSTGPPKACRGASSQIQMPGNRKG